MRSKFVTQEWRHALSLRRDSFIRPVYWEEPMPTAPGLPPKELSELYFHWIPACSRGTESKMSSNLWQKMRPRTTRCLVGVLVFFAVAFGFLAYFPARNDWNRERIITIDTRTVPDGSSFSATISGKVNDSKTGVWVLVRPRGDNVCWVHGRAEVSN